MRDFLVDLTPLKTSPAYRNLWLGGASTGIGSALVSVVVGLQVYELSGSTLAVGLVGLFALVPLVMLGLYGGSLVDAYDRRKVLLVTNLGLCLVGLAFALVTWSGLATVGALYGLVAVQSGLFAIHSPARSAVIPRLLPAELLPSANALGSLAMGLTFAVGPMVGGLMVDLVGYGAAYSAQVAMQLVAFVLLLALPSLPPLGEVRKAGVRSVLEGLAYLKTRPSVAMTFVVDLFAMILAMPRVLFPAIGAIMIGGGATTVGILVSGIAVGSILGGLFSGRLGRINRQGLTIVVSVVVWGLMIAGFGAVVAMAPGPLADGGANWALWPATALLVFAGAADTVSAVFRTTILQVATPDALRGRLQGVFVVVVAGGPHLGSLFLGVVATATGEAWAAILGGLACALMVAVVALRQKGLVAYDARKPGAEDGVVLER
jgi:MFS family permease